MNELVSQMKIKTQKDLVMMISLAILQIGRNNTRSYIVSIVKLTYFTLKAY